MPGYRRPKRRGFIAWNPNKACSTTGGMSTTVTIARNRGRQSRVEQFTGIVRSRKAVRDAKEAVARAPLSLSGNDIDENDDRKRVAGHRYTRIYERICITGHARESFFRVLIAKPCECLNAY